MAVAHDGEEGWRTANAIVKSIRRRQTKGFFIPEERRRPSPPRRRGGVNQSAAAPAVARAGGSINEGQRQKRGVVAADISMDVQKGTVTMEAGDE